jgi:hypothetical protein
MAIPGFTAETSLCRTKSHYCIAGMSTPVGSGGARIALYPSPACIRLCEWAAQLGGCYLRQCLCRCEGGVYSPSPRPVIRAAHAFSYSRQARLSICRSRIWSCRVPAT